MNPEKFITNCNFKFNTSMKTQFAETTYLTQIEQNTNSIRYILDLAKLIDPK